MLVILASYKKVFRLVKFLQIISSFF